MLNIPKSTYYRHRKGPGKRELQRRELAERIIVVQDVNMGRMGIMRMTAALRLDGFERHPGHNQVAAVMREFGLHAVIRRKNNYRVCVKKGVLPDGTVLENKLNREFQQTEPGTHFVTDVTYVPTIEGWLYVSPIIDLCTREVVECKMGIRQDLELALATLSGMKPYSGENIILHSDQGALYTSPGYRKLASELGITLSYSRKGTCWDNAVMEGWNGTLKSEWMYHPAYMRHRHLVPAAQAAREVLEYVQYYNEVRIQKGLGYKSPKQYRKSVE